MRHQSDDILVDIGRTPQINYSNSAQYNENEVGFAIFTPQPLAANFTLVSSPPQLQKSTKHSPPVASVFIEIFPTFSAIKTDSLIQEYQYHHYKPCCIYEHS